MSAAADDIFRQAVASFQAGRPDDAERQFKKVLRRQPNHVAALNLLSMLQSQLGKYDEAERHIAAAARLNPKSDATFYNYGLILKALNRPAEALECFNKAIAINSGVAETWNNRGVILNELKRYSDAVADFENAIQLQPNYAEAYCNKGKSLAIARRSDEALSAYEKASALNPNLAEAWAGRGNILGELDRFEEARDACERALKLNPGLVEAWLNSGNIFKNLLRYDDALAAFDHALALKADFAEAWLGRGNVLIDTKRFDEARAAYDNAYTIKPDLAEAWLGRGNALLEGRRHKEALEAYDKAISLKPDLAEAWLGCGNVFSGQKRYDEALVAYDRALDRKKFAEAWLGRGAVFTELKQFDKALSAYDEAFALKPDLPGVEGIRLHTKLHLCDWRNYDNDRAHLIAAIGAGKPNSLPFDFLGVTDSPADQLECATLAVAKKFPPAATPIWRGERYKHDRIRIGYLSADFRQHVVSSLLAGVFECHDRSRFEVTALSFGPSDDSDLRRRLEAAFDRFVDVQPETENQIAQRIRSLEIDILVDLMGITADARPGILAQRPAPIQVNFLGYLGTIGAPYIDYIIGDRIVIPEEQKAFYKEQVIYLPHCFQPTDRARPVADKQFSRKEVGLPPEGFVFCSFNANYKITPSVFDRWMRILQRVDGSVLWLVAENPIAQQNLKAEAGTRGVDPDRLIFAPKLPLHEHQARVRAADLFLDSWPYNAGATASDTLWVGVPIVTRLGQTFVGRMAASMLRSVGLPELVAETPDEYEVLAVELATDAGRLAAIKEKLARNRLTEPLFDTVRYTKDIEAAYVDLVSRRTQ